VILRPSSICQTNGSRDIMEQRTLIPLLFSRLKQNLRRMRALPTSRNLSRDLMRDLRLGHGYDREQSHRCNRNRRSCRVVCSVHLSVDRGVRLFDIDKGFQVEIHDD